ncbi:hypothetical protein XENORESO_006569 [Xenotaenia resolanae]|uniref:Uncharacterized protein n=1 Tax=Xenotaenia resolanae TaxID=208358 RepID=A0ABV0WNJ2_9TELE
MRPSYFNIRSVSFVQPCGRGLFVTSTADRIPASDVSTNSPAHPTPIKLEEMQQLNSSKDTRESDTHELFYIGTKTHIQDWEDHNVLSDDRI